MEEAYLLSLSPSASPLREHPPLAVNPDLALRAAVLKTISKREGVCTRRYRISIPMLDCLYTPRHPQLGG